MLNSETLEMISKLPSYLWVVLAVAFVAVVALLLRNSSSINIGKFLWNRKTDFDEEANKRITDLEVVTKMQADRIASLERQHHQDEMLGRINIEFRALRDKCRERRGRFQENIIEMHLQQFSDAIYASCPERKIDEIELHKSLYASCIGGTIREEVAPEMTRLVFDNNFKALPTATTPRNEAEAIEKEFAEDCLDRCGYLLRISVSSMRLKWKAPFSRDVFEKKYMDKVHEKALNEGVLYYRDVIDFRDLSISTMYNEYSDIFHSKESFKKFVEYKFKELY